MMHGVASFLDLRDTCRLRAVCKTIRAVFDNRYFFGHFVIPQSSVLAKRLTLAKHVHGPGGPRDTSFCDLQCFGILRATHPDDLTGYHREILAVAERELKRIASKETTMQVACEENSLFRCPVLAHYDFSSDRTQLFDKRIDYVERVVGPYRQRAARAQFTRDEYRNLCQMQARMLVMFEAAEGLAATIAPLQKRMQVARSIDPVGYDKYINLAHIDEQYPIRAFEGGLQALEEGRVPKCRLEEDVCDAAWRIVKRPRTRYILTDSLMRDASSLVERVIKFKPTTPPSQVVESREQENNANDMVSLALSLVGKTDEEVERCLVSLSEDELRAFQDARASIS